MIDDGTRAIVSSLEVCTESLVRVVELVSSLVLLTRRQLVCCGWYVGLRMGLCPELLLRWCALSEDIELLQVSELGRELIFSWEECNREHNRYYA